MASFKQVRLLGVAIVATASLAACVTSSDIEALNTRLEQIDARVQTVAQDAASANQSAQRANQRLDQIEGRIQQLETQSTGSQSSSAPQTRAPGV